MRTITRRGDLGRVLANGQSELLNWIAFQSVLHVKFSAVKSATYVTV